MAIILKLSEHTEIPKGWHDATIETVELEENVPVHWGTADRLRIRFILEETNQALVQRYIAYLSKHSELGRFLTGLLGELPDEFDLGTLVGARCRIRVEHREGKNGRRWAHVVEADSFVTVDEGTDESSIDDDLFDYE